MMKKNINVNADRETVWQAILSYRHSDPGNRKVISSEGGRTVIEEKFGGVPVVGSSRIVYEENEKPFEKIDYHLVESDKLSKFEGAWTLTETNEGKSTSVQLTALLDIALPVPFKDSILNAQAEKDMSKRLQYIKKEAERK